MMVVSKEHRIGGGGRPSASGFLFELSAGNLSLDFANTLDGRPTAAPRELLTTYEDLLAWSRQSRVLSANEAARLVFRARRRPAAARLALSRARMLRETLFEVFSAAAGSGRAKDAEAALDRETKLAYEKPVLRDRRLLWEDDRDSLDFFVGPVVRSAIELLTAPPALSRVRVCAAPDCDWLFVDASRNRSRQWCDMTVCGNRAKARRFYRRQKSRARKRAR